MPNSRLPGPTIRRRGLILLLTVGLTFWLGVAIGGARHTVNPVQRKLWFSAQVCAGCHTFAALAIGGDRATQPSEGAAVGHWRSIDIGVHYTGVAGLLNLLIILDAIGRADGAGRKPKRQPAGAKS